MVKSQNSENGRELSGFWRRLSLMDSKIVKNEKPPAETDFSKGDTASVIKDSTSEEQISEEVNN